MSGLTRRALTISCVSDVALPTALSNFFQIIEMLVSRLALVDALNAPTTELRSQHRYVSSTVNDAKNCSSTVEIQRNPM